MNKEDFLDWLRGILITLLIASIVVVAVVGVIRVASVGAQKGCERLGDRVGYNTKRVSGSCRIEIRPNVWVAEYNIVSILPLIDCGKDSKE